MYTYKVQITLKTGQIIYQRIEARSISEAQAIARNMFEGCRVGLVSRE